MAKLSHGILILFFTFVLVASETVVANYMATSSTTTTAAEEPDEVLPSDFKLNVELRLEERSVWCSLSIRQTPWLNQSQAIEAVKKEIASRLASYNLSFEIESVKFRENTPMSVDFIIPNLPIEGGPLKYGYNNYSVELGWLVDWAGAPFTQWAEVKSSHNQGVINYAREIEGKTYSFTLDPLIMIQGFTNITKRTETQIVYSFFVPNMILDLQILQDGIKVTNITNFLNKSEFEQIYNQGEQYQDKILKNTSEELALRLSPLGMVATNFEVCRRGPYSTVGIHYTIKGVIEKVTDKEFKADLRFLNIPLSEFTVSQHSYSTVLQYVGTIAGKEGIITIYCKSLYRIGADTLLCLPLEFTTTTETTTTTTTTTTERPGNLYTYLVTVLADNSVVLVLISLSILVGTLIWRGHVRVAWSRSCFDYDTFKLLVRMRGGRTRVNLLRSLGEQKNKLQLAKELGMDWKAVDRNIRILLKYGLIRESESSGKVKYYSLTPDGRKVLELLEELNNTGGLRDQAEE